MPISPTDITNLTCSEVIGIGATGYSTPMMRASFKVRGQGPYSVDIPKSDFSADLLDQKVQEFASQLVMLRDRYPGA